MKKLSSLILLNILTNKNFFFEKYKFLNNFLEGKQHWYIFWMFIKNQVLPIIFLLFLNTITRSDALTIELLMIYIISMFMKCDASDWKLFERSDMLLQIPNHAHRFFIVLGYNVIFK